MVLPILFFFIISLIAGIALSFFGKLFAVKTDDKVLALKNSLPGINCGACGFSGCERYAKAIIAGAAPDQCKPGGEETALKIGEVLGLQISASEPETAFVSCSGSCSQKYDYAGTKSCAASELYYNGKEDCRFGCVGLGDCANVCPNDAIVITESRAVVLRHKCIACGLCVKVCPKKIIRLQKSKQDVNVMCGSRDVGKLTKASCEKGCIACKICEKKCPKSAIKVRDNVALIDGDLCDNCHACVEACPVGCIAVRKECEANVKKG